MSIKTNELPKLTNTNVATSDTVLMDTAAAGTGRYAVSDLAGKMAGQLFPMGAGGVPYGKELTDSWATLQAKIKAGNFDGINIGDYKRITLTGGEVVIMEVAGIDQYYKCGDTSIGHHIDFISRDCLKGARVMNSENNNNGTEEEPNPWRSSELFKDLNETVFKTLPSDLQSCIIEKRALLESRYSSAGKINDNNSWAWNNAGKLWLPTEVEVFGAPHWCELGYGSGGGGCNLQYPIFMGGSKHIIKGDGNGGGRVYWWEASARRASSTTFCNVSSNGVATSYAASSDLVRAPLCFRIG